MMLAEEASLEKLPLTAETIKKHLKIPCVVLLSGEMGSGKTTFVQFFAKQYSKFLTSPTYSLINTVGNIAHADLYRIESEKELHYLELSLYAECQYVFIEWGQPFLQHIMSEFGSRFSYYELKICEKPQKTTIREYFLSQCPTC